MNTMQVQVAIKVDLPALTESQHAAVQQAIHDACQQTWAECERRGHKLLLDVLEGLDYDAATIAVAAEALGYHRPQLRLVTDDTADATPPPA